MATPKSLVSAVCDHWETVEWLAQLSRELPGFEPEHMTAAVARLLPALPPDGRQQVLRQLVKADIVQPLARATRSSLIPACSNSCC